MVSFRTRQDKIFDAVNIAIMVIILFLTAYPLYFVLIASISDPARVATGSIVLWPRGINFEGYKFIFSDPRIGNGYMNSILYAVGQTVISLLITLPAGYALARKDMKGRKVIMLFLIFTMYFSGGIIPFYILIRNLGLINNVFSLMLPNALSVFNVIIARTFFAQNLPDEMLESAQMDGCSNTRFFLRIAVPLSSALIAITILFNVVGNWNAFFHAMLFINDLDKYPLQLVLRKILILSSELANPMAQDWMSAEEAARAQYIADLLRYGLIVVAIAPLLILYPFIQKHFVRGVMVGSIKG